MVFSSLVFLCVFFPLQMLVYYLAKGIEARNTVLILFSLVFYAWGEPFFIVLLLFMCFVDWAVSQGIYKYRGTGKEQGLPCAGLRHRPGPAGLLQIHGVYPCGETHELVRASPAWCPRSLCPSASAFTPSSCSPTWWTSTGERCLPSGNFRRLLLYVIPVPPVHCRPHRPV